MELDDAVENQEQIQAVSHTIEQVSDAVPVIGNFALACPRAVTKHLFCSVLDKRRPAIYAGMHPSGCCWLCAATAAIWCDKDLVSGTIVIVSDMSTE